MFTVCHVRWTNDLKTKLVHRLLFIHSGLKLEIKKSCSLIKLAVSGTQ